MVGEGAPPGLEPGTSRIRVQHGRTEAERASVLHLGSGGWTRPSPRPAHRGRAGGLGQGTTSLRATGPAVHGSKRKSQVNSICDFDSSLEFADPQNRSSPGYEPSSCSGSLRRQFHSFEGAPYGSARVSPARFAPEKTHYLPSPAASGQGWSWAVAIVLWIRPPSTSQENCHHVSSDATPTSGDVNSGRKLTLFQRSNFDPPAG